MDFLDLRGDEPDLSEMTDLDTPTPEDDLPSSRILEDIIHSAGWKWFLVAADKRITSLLRYLESGRGSRPIGDQESDDVVRGRIREIRFLCVLFESALAVVKGGEENGRQA